MSFDPGDIADASRAFDFNGKPVVILSLAPSGRAKFRRLQRDRLGQVLEIRVDGALVSSPILSEPIEGRQVQIGGNMTLEEAQRLAARLTPRQNGR